MEPLQEDVEFLEHFGIKGMQWGVRRDRRAQGLITVGQGKGTKGQKLSAVARYTPLDALKFRGIKKASRLRGERQLARNDRVRSGKSSVLDKLLYVGGTKAQDIIPTTGADRTNRHTANATKAAVGASITGALLVKVGLTTYKTIKTTAKEANRLRQFD